MKDASVHKDELLKKLEENRTTHRATFEAAMVVYQEKMTELLGTLISRARDGKIIPHRALYDLPMPEDHTKEYDLAIEMLQMETRDVLIISEQEFRQYVLDLWEWSQSFTSNTRSYVAS